MVLDYHIYKGASIWKTEKGYVVEGQKDYRKSLRAAKQAAKRV